MGKIVKNFNEFHEINESQKFKDFIDIAKAAERVYFNDINIKKTTNGFTYTDIDGNIVNVIVKGKKASIVGGKQNMSLNDFAYLISNGDVKSLEELCELQEAHKVKISKSLIKASENTMMLN